MQEPKHGNSHAQYDISKRLDITISGGKITEFTSSICDGKKIEWITSWEGPKHGVPT